MNISIVSLMALITLSAHSEATELPHFGGTTRPVVPALRVNREPALCGELLVDATEAFASPSPRVNVAAATYSRHPPLTWGEPVAAYRRPDVSSPGTAFNSGRNIVYRLDLDLDGNGRRQAVLLQSIPFNWRGDYGAAYVVARDATADQIDQAILAVHHNADANSKSAYPWPERLLTQYFPSEVHAPASTQSGDLWTNVHRIIPWKGRYYHLHHGDVAPNTSVAPIQLFRLQSNGPAQLTCEVDFPGTDDAVKALQAVAGLPSLMTLLRSVGRPGPDCGTLHSGWYHVQSAEHAYRRLAFRPWAVARMLGDGPDAHFRYDSRMEQFLEEWSATEPWNRREYDSLRMAQHEARRGVSRYLIAAFGLPERDASNLAERVVNDLVAAWILIPSGYQASDPYFVDEYAQGSAELNRALVRQDSDELRRVLHAYERSLDVDPPRDSVPKEVRSDPDLRSAALHAAIEWPYGMRVLLQAGADPNAPNRFGKTPLMAAAHLNRPDIVRLLLAAGAQVNARTEGGSDDFCGSSMLVGRTALTYAAENASPVVMRLLLEAGADPEELVDGRDLLGRYLTRNPRLTEAEKQSGVQALAARAAEFKGPSFDCRRASNRRERAICRNEDLAVLDLEMDRAFRQLAAANHPGIRSDQREWLKSRDRTCNSRDTGVADCLARAMRTRVRYLHLLVSEHASTQENAGE
jgi:uncharacterized protein YecT (DUF1311 family)